MPVPSVPGSCQAQKRFLSGQEMLASQVLPTTDEHAALSRAPKLQLDSTTESVQGRMAGNSMSTPCVASVFLTAILALDLK